MEKSPARQAWSNHIKKANAEHVRDLGIIFGSVIGAFVLVNRGSPLRLVSAPR